MEHPYITYDNKYIETLWWLLKQLYNKGLLYKGYTIQPYSPGAGTGLSSHELNQPGCYRDVKGYYRHSTVCYPYRGLEALAEKANLPKETWGKPCVVAWTTTPWHCLQTLHFVLVQRLNTLLLRPITPYDAREVDTRYGCKSCSCLSEVRR